MSTWTCSLSWLRWETSDSVMAGSSSGGDRDEVAGSLPLRVAALKALLRRRGVGVMTTLELEAVEAVSVSG
jgi:hypothetical protein